MALLSKSVVARTLRTDTVGCASDAEFLCKLQCLRAALSHALRERGVRAWLVDAGRQVLTDLLLFADKVSRVSDITTDNV